ncbi:MAG: hypothetical protein R2838_14955 [Caldilineaceae bacterium]
MFVISGRIRAGAQDGTQTRTSPPALATAADAGVELYAYTCALTPERIVLELPVTRPATSAQSQTAMVCRKFHGHAAQTERQ